MKYRLEIEFESDKDLKIGNNSSHVQQIFETRLQVEVAEMIYNKLKIPCSNIKATIMKEY